ncbi:uncharacterized protein HD556DRAFT_469962 [Suillus plorans]|uniref:Uncharacterized protein n=1 Tax=Suillus plorans TaxID=116603 RepID=A0A9P7DGV5_9AGAM|nr:uncharacterized protein HD556DRAFT_469962 [Suillus plorans]KAG1793726.1 hypothetical protein HD556DRAFT_469962 [Suillus plorans]
MIFDQPLSRVRLDVVIPGSDETVHHYLFDCPQYAQERHQLANTLRRQATSISFILTAEEATKPLMRYIRKTGRFKPTFGEISDK